LKVDILEIREFITTPVPIASAEVLASLLKSNFVLESLFGVNWDHKL